MSNTAINSIEKDPYGLEAGVPGSKLDAGKAAPLRGLINYFPAAIECLGSVSEEPANYGLNELVAAFIEGPGNALPAAAELLSAFPRACLCVATISVIGAKKYSWTGWRDVPNALGRYPEAAVRHRLKHIFEFLDADTKQPHLGHYVWNMLAIIELYLEDEQNQGAFIQGTNLITATMEGLAELEVALEERALEDVTLERRTSETRPWREDALEEDEWTLC